MTIIAPIRPWSGLLAPLWWALRALRNEVLGFRFDYPLEVVLTAGPRESLRYYVYSERLFFDAMELDPQGIPVHRSRTFETYNPAYIAWYGLASLEQSLRGIDPLGRERFLGQVKWLEKHAVRRDDGSVVWPLTFDWQEGERWLRAPWVSALAQGLAISTLVRGFRMTRERRLLELCLGATRAFEKDVNDGGVRTFEGNHVLYEEYPAHPLSRVLDGFLFSLLGLYDLFAETGESRVFQLFADGVDGLKHLLPYWDYRGKWSWYGAHAYLCPPHYNKLNSVLLTSLGRLSGAPAPIRYGQAWAPSRLTGRDRVEILLVFLFTKNRRRLQRLGRWS